jgi:hypothetical protein
MFTFVHDIDDVAIYFNNDFISLEFVPEDCTDLFDKGFGSVISNGDFGFSFNNGQIIFYIAKYGDGQGGNFSLTLNMTREIEESLEQAIREWREFLKERDE